MDILFDLTGVVIGFEQLSYETTETDTTSVIGVAVIVQRGILRRDVVVSAFTRDGTAIGVCVCACGHMCVLCKRKDACTFSQYTHLLALSPVQSWERLGIRLSTTCFIKPCQSADGYFCMHSILCPSFCIECTYIVLHSWE